MAACCYAIENDKIFKLKLYKRNGVERILQSYSTRLVTQRHTCTRSNNLLLFCTHCTLLLRRAFFFFGQWMTTDWFSCLLWLLCCFLEAKEVEAEIL